MKRVNAIPGAILISCLLLVAWSAGVARVEESKEDRLYRAFLTTELQKLSLQLEIRVNDNYEFFDRALLDKRITERQYDSLMKFRNHIWEYRIWLNEIRVQNVSKAEGIAENTADTLHFLLIRNLDYRCKIREDSLTKLKEQTYDLPDWIGELPYCVSMDRRWLGMGNVRDYGRADEFIPAATVALQDCTLEHLITSVYILRLRSFEAEVLALDNMRIAIAERK